jgi:apolipoprotein N-acyltransferase
VGPVLDQRQRVLVCPPLFILMGMAVAEIVGFGVLGAVIPAIVFIAAKAKPVDVAMAVVGYGGFVATVASMGWYYRSGPYLFVPPAALFTAAWVLATVRVVHYGGPVQWRRRRKQNSPVSTEGRS